MTKLNRHVLTACAVFGFTIGLYTGWSQSPVVGPMLSGVLGLISGGAIALLTRKGKDEHFELTPKQLSMFSVGVVVLCLMSVAGTGVGCWLRVAAISHSKGKLVEISSHIDTPPDFAARLLILQQRLSDNGISPTQNNFVVSKYIDWEIGDREGRVGQEFETLCVFLQKLKEVDKRDENSLKTFLDDSTYGSKKAEDAVKFLKAELGNVYSLDQNLAKILAILDQKPFADYKPGVGAPIQNDI